MACYKFWSDGKKVLACGQCIGCKLERSRQWATRCMHEAQLYDRNCFILLTYRDAPFSLDHRDFQLFMKRARQKLGAFRFFMCGEYGEPSRDNGFRYLPHFHAVLFGMDFPDKQYFKKSETGHKLYRSRTLEGLWPHGHCTVAEFSFDAAAYVARYCCKKVTCPQTEDLYEHIDLETGEVSVRLPEYGRMSLRPGIGSRWFQKFWRDAYPEGKVVVNGAKRPAPRYYDKLFQSRGFEQKLSLAQSRQFNMLKWLEDNDDVRLRAKEAVTKARLRFGKPI